MMKVLGRATLVALLDRIANEQVLIAPTEQAGVILYRPVDSSDEIAADFSRPLLSIKDAFFPPTEPLLTIAQQNGQIALQEILPDREQVIFGVRPCDARGMKALDALFMESSTPDPYYVRRRQQTTLIGLACTEMGDTCFCTSVGGAPDETADVDLMLTELGDGYAVEIVTDRGEALLDGLKLADAAEAPPSPQLNDLLPIPNREAWVRHFEDSYWDELGERCLSCRLCAYVCPTCRCFDVRDEPLPGPQGTTARYFERIRCWDSCTGANYRRVAGGHNPRAEKGERLRNRFFCKFHYYPQQVGAAACTGCGRCIDVCPVNVDVTEVLALIERGIVEAPQEVKV